MKPDDDNEKQDNDSGMNPTSPPENQATDNEKLPNVRLDEQSFEFLAKFAKEKSGLKISSTKETKLYNKILKRLQELHLDNFPDYCKLLTTDPEEEKKYINLITNSLTSFFRDKAHFNYLEYSILPNIIASNSKIRIWSAGCSTGEEAYSIAILVDSLLREKNISHVDVKILATDINTESIKKAQIGIYELQQIKNLSPDIKKNCFLQGTGKNTGLVRVKDNIKRYVTFRYMNLAEDPWPIQTHFNVIFCRNVLIYLYKDVANRVVHQFNHLLLPNGYFVIGSSEILSEVKSGYITAGKSIYKKQE